MNKRNRVLRLMVVFAALAMVVSACSDDDSGTTAATEAPTTTAAETTTTEGTATTEAPTTTEGTVEETTTTEALPEITYVNACQPDTEYDTTPYAAPAYADPGGTVYRTGIFQDTTTDNFWAYMDPQSTVWNAYLLGPTKPALFGTNLPGLDLTNDVAASADPGVAAADGDAFSVTVAIRDDATWSDGAPITANDVVFTADTVCQFALGGNWVGNYQWAQTDEATGEYSDTLGLIGVEAIDDFTVKFTWNKDPGLAVWPYSVGVSVIMPKAPWQAVVQDAKASEDPAEVLYQASGAGDASGGPTIFFARESGAFAESVGNATYYDNGRAVASGGVDFTTGPFIGSETFELYGDQSAAVLALKAGEVDYLYNSLGLQRGLLDQITGDANLTPIVNATNGFRYLAFNMRRDPMARKGFRDALAFMIDKEYITGSVLQGVAFPLYATVPEGNTSWYNAELADAWQAEITDLALDTRYDGTPFMEAGEDEELGTADDVAYQATGTEARLHAAVSALMADGFTWAEGDAPDYADNAIVPGKNIMLDGAPVQEITILAPGPGYDPLRATFSLFVAQAAKDLGFNATAYPTDFNVLVNAVFVPDDEGNLDFDMFMLGWSLGNPALPTYHESFWAGKNDTLINDGNNNTGFNDP
ncbi:MAG: ABC transporter substrate-binding protein, partial [Acidimicrobiia bacterium]|nr:ABC transporter substrate-binding protein [Acidimicrobiia bacterium]